MYKFRTFRLFTQDYCILHEDRSYSIIPSNFDNNERINFDGEYCFISDRIYIYKYTEFHSRFFFENTWIEIPPESELNYTRLNDYECKITWKTYNSIIFQLTYWQPDYGNLDMIGHTLSEVDYNFGLYLYIKFQKQKEK